MVMDEKVKRIANLSCCLLELFYKHNVTVYVEVDDDNQLIIRTSKEDDFRYVRIYLNDATPTLIKGIKRVREYKFQDLLKEFENDEELRYEVDDNGVYFTRKAFTR